MSRNTEELTKQAIRMVQLPNVISQTGNESQGRSISYSCIVICVVGQKSERRQKLKLKSSFLADVLTEIPAQF